MASATETSRSPFREVLNWALPELAGYALAALGAVFVFTGGPSFTPTSGLACQRRPRSRYPRRHQ